jgi:NDP-sugar pyrophosphorylase family protein
MLTVALKELPPEENISPYGVARLDSDMHLKGFVEKPRPGSEPSRMINTAFYLFSPRIREVLAEMGDRGRDIGGDLIPYLTEKGYPVYGYPIKGYWIDIGTPERLHQAAMDCLSGAVRHFDRKYCYKPNQWIHPSTLSKIKPSLDSGDIKLIGNVSIGRNCHLEKGVTVENSHIGHTSLIERNAEIRDSMIMSFAHIKHMVSIRRSIVGRHSTIEEHSVLGSNDTNDALVAVIGENVNLPSDSAVSSGVRVAPLKHSHSILATGRFVELGTDERNIYFSEKVAMKR